MGTTRPSPSEITQRAEYLADRFGEHYVGYQYVFVEFIVEHLTDLSRAFGGDLQQMMLLALIGQRRLRALREPEVPTFASTDQMSITASRLADVTGIPRETVRRKLALLRDRGWIQQRADGAWSIIAQPDGESPVRRDLAAQHLGGRHRVARLVAELEVLASQSGTGAWTSAAPQED